jgi:serpin B
MYRLLLAPLLALGLALPIALAEPAPNATPNLGPIVKGNTEFALELYNQLRKQQDGNLFLSPYSISTALAMTYAGARGQTAEQMQKTLHFPAGEGLHPLMGALIRQINDADNPRRGYKLTTANALWGQKGYPFLDAFVQLNKRDYGAGLKEVDFIRAAEAARGEINKWVEKETNDKIKDLMKPGTVTSDTRLVLTNAIYFKGDWASKFKKDLTKDAPFQKASGKVNVPMMHQKARYKYAEAPDLQALEMPYVGKELSMVVLLPKKADNLAAVEKGLTPEALGKWLGQLREHEVEVFLPRIKVTAEFQLRPTLSAMGMPAAFEAGADLSGIDGGKGSLAISAVVHKAFVDVNEEGTEAAAATGITIEPTAVRIVPVFRADHPFVFLIRDNRSGSILFLGRLSDPQ